MEGIVREVQFSAVWPERLSVERPCAYVRDLARGAGEVEGVELPHGLGEN